MLRSLLAVIWAREHLTINVAGRIVHRALPSASQSSRLLHLSALKLSDDDNPTRSKNRQPNSGPRFRPEKTKLRPVSAELKHAAINVARSLPGDWTKTAEELVSRLRLHQNPETTPETEEPQRKDKSLLQTMEIGRSFAGRPRNGQGQNRRSAAASNNPDDSLYSKSIVQSETSFTTRRVARRAGNYTELFAEKRLGIFDADKLKKEGGKPVASRASDDLWVKVEAERICKALGAVPKNAFEEMIQWTKEGKLWKFPVDNEADMDEERKYKFHDHVFLERYLSEFPDSGPIRKFMELVCLGLSKNPWISVNEKIEHIRWFGEYFREKQDILNASIGEQGSMKTRDGQLE